MVAENLSFLMDEDLQWLTRLLDSPIREARGFPVVSFQDAAEFTSATNVSPELF